ncbi:hypothetical protein F511_46457 [Dorcoceras hygrometricum]|uniref:Uncharacterized protein n=1 Tax=Dorcoceras hygrometricum TaxID=472368 RepID=A0A2Z7A0F0_9LAMI|nr:hypothetical protein F511_46457 [Dorcoceras hygrometricum]
MRKLSVQQRASAQVHRPFTQHRASTVAHITSAAAQDRRATMREAAHSHDATISQGPPHRRPASVDQHRNQRPSSALPTSQHLHAKGRPIMRRTCGTGAQDDRRLGAAMRRWIGRDVDLSDRFQI